MRTARFAESIFDWKTDFDPALSVVSTKLWLPCDSAEPDSAIYVFRESERKWNLLLATESDFDPSSDETDSGMQYRISDQPPNPQINVKTLFVEVVRRNGIFFVDGVLVSHPAGFSGRARLRPGKETVLPIW